MVLHVFISFLGGVPLCIPYGLYSGTSLGGTTRGTLEGYPGWVLSLCPGRSCRGLAVGLCQAVSWLVACRVAGLAGRVSACIATHLAPRSCVCVLSRATARVAVPIRRVTRR